MEYIRSNKRLSDALSIKSNGLSGDIFVEVKELKGGYNNKIIKYTLKISNRTIDIVAKKYEPIGTMFCFLAKYFTPLPIDYIKSSRDRLIYEARILKELSDAGLSVPRIYAIDLNYLILWMEYIPGETIYKRLQVEEKYIYGIVYKYGNLLSKLHRKNISLIDSSLSNYLITSSGEVFLIDYEISSTKKLFEWDVAAFLFSLERLELENKRGIKKFFLDGYSVIENLDLKKVSNIQKMLRPYSLISPLDHILRFGRWK